ncbi:MAG TPA: hypothetical protein VHY79_17330 [Rhizomicrobium sp.]|jgi:hypothetical protein|nr:hypothetical protein [Rhizomicrobium sp.]
MLKITSLMFAIGAVAAGAMPWAALAQSDSAAEAYAAGVKLGRTLQDASQCTGSGEFRGGCFDGIQESQFDRQADQAMDRVTDDTRPAERTPLLSPPPDLFHQPFSKPDDGRPPNN